MIPVHPILDYLSVIAASPGVTDATLYSSGLVAVRCNTQLSVTEMPALVEPWPSMTLGLFPERPADRRRGATKVLQSTDGRRFRLTLVKNGNGESLSVRPLPSSIREVHSLGLPVGVLEAFLGLKGGLCLVCGPTGSGKSTTIASLVQARAEQVGGKCVSLEDPIEYLYAPNDRSVFDQREIGGSVLSYEDGLREALLMNPDLIVVQELREAAAARMALSAALSGHLVIASLHAFSAHTAPQRFLSLLEGGLDDSGAKDALAASLELVLVQRLAFGDSGLVPLFESFLLRDRGERIGAFERMLRQGNWNALKQEIEAGLHPGLCSLEKSKVERQKQGLLAQDWREAV